MIGPWEIFMILIVVLLLFGAGRLPTIMGDVAKGIKTFKSGLKDEDVAQKDAEKKRITHASEQHVSETQKSKEL
jgi:sec-independent protein translocase protein TatA